MDSSCISSRLSVGMGDDRERCSHVVCSKRLVKTMWFKLWLAQIFWHYPTHLGFALNLVRVLLGLSKKREMHGSDSMHFLSSNFLLVYP